MPPKYRGGGGGGDGGGRGGGGGGRGTPRGGRGGGGPGRGRGGPPGDSAPRTPSQAYPSRGGPPGARHVSQPPTSPPAGASVPAGPRVQPSQFPALPSQSMQSPPQAIRSPAQPQQQQQQPIPAPQVPVQTAPEVLPRTRAAESLEVVVDLPARPGYGKEGRPVTLFANHFRLSNIPNVKVYQYAFTIPTKEGDAPTKGLATAVWESAEVKAAIGKPYSGLIFNGRAIAWGTELIRNIPTIEVARGRTSLRVNFTYATEFNLSDLTAYIKKQIPNSPEIFQCMTFLNQVIADSLTKSSRYMAVGRKYFPTVEDDREVARIDDMSLLEFRRGFYQAVHWGGNNGLTINVNVTTGIFWNSQMHTIIELALRTLGRPASEGMSLSNLTEMAFRQVSRNLRGLKFFIKYRGPQKERQIHMATSLSKETARSKRFDVNGQMMSVADYFQKTYNVRLRYPDAPLVKKAENFFPMELCYIVPLQRYPQKLDGMQAAAMIKFASKPPEIRKRDIEFKVRSLNWQDDATLKRFGMTVSNQMAAVPARILQHPRLSGGAAMSGGSTFEPKSGKWDLRGYKLKNSKSLSRWGILVFDDQRRFAGPGGGLLGRFVQTLCQGASEYGMNIDRNPSVTYGNFNAPQASVHRSCEELYNRVQKEKGGPPEMLMFFIKGKSAIMYEHIKQYCDTIKGIQSQVVDSFNAQKKGGDRAFHANLLLKMNSKLGGTTVTLQTPLVGPGFPTIFIGADVSHAAAGSKAPSLATVVGSVDHEGVRYACPLPMNQNNREESIAGVRSMITDIVNIYKKNTNTYPVRVMYFRDGVAEGQFAKVKEMEVTAIKDAIAALSGHVPTVTAIVVRKRNHTRLFPKENEGDRGSRGNVHPGTVVDQEITHPRDFDFYLVPHSSIQGTARPAHYYVIHDEHKLNSDFIQKLCYQMSYVYQRSSGAVSLHPAVYYAHLAGNRARAHDPSRDRDDDSSGSGMMGTRGAVDVKVTPLRPIHANIANSMWWM